MPDFRAPRQVQAVEWFERARLRGVRLSKGRHKSVEQGLCVMELAALLAGESFSDKPSAVCPVIAGFMSTYNDGLDDVRRQDLLPFAAQAISTSGDPEVLRARVGRCFAFARELCGSPLRCRVTEIVADALGDDAARGRAAGVWAARAVPRGHDPSHRRALDFLGELIRMGERRRYDTTPVPAGEVRPSAR